MLAEVAGTVILNLLCVLVMANEGRGRAVNGNGMRKERAGEKGRKEWRKEIVGLGWAILRNEASHAFESQSLLSGRLHDDSVGQTVIGQQIAIFFLHTSTCK